MTDITDDQRADVRDLSAYARANSDTVLGTRLARVLALLPSNLTDPQPVLPTEPGTFRDSHGHIWELLAAGDWYRMGALHSYEISLVRAAAPFTRLVPERPQIDKDALADLVRAMKPMTVEGQTAALMFVIENGLDRA